jgi:hypothetical protein
MRTWEDNIKTDDYVDRKYLVQSRDRTRLLLKRNSASRIPYMAGNILSNLATIRIWGSQSGGYEEFYLLG